MLEISKDTFDGVPADWTKKWTSEGIAERRKRSVIRMFVAYMAY
jgi:hypothetical protein